MQLIDLNLTRRRILTQKEAARILEAIETGVLPIDLEESMDLDGDLVLDPEEFRRCLEVAGDASPE